MISDIEEKEIRDYLLSKKLPLDLLLEVNDHFISQINSLEREKDLQFPEAFKEVKENWRNDLTLSWKCGFSLEDSTDFMRKISKQIERENILESLKLGVPYVLIIFLVANFCNVYFFQAFFVSAILIPVLVGIANYIYHYKDFRLPKKYPSNILTLHQKAVFLFFLLISPMLNIFSKVFDHPKKFQEIFLVKFAGRETLTIIAVFGTLILFIVGIIYSLISQKKYLEQIKHIKPFLKYLKIS